jgi:hypothetical protein
MKKYLLMLILSVFVLNSCKDIITSDDNILKKKIEYNYVVTDQGKSVIMPLHAGNRWIYKVTEKALSGQSNKISYDTILVLSEKNINGEKWFETQYMCSAANPVLLTNTDVGLWFKCSCDDNSSYLEAEYPKFEDKYLSGNFNTISYHSDSMKLSFDTLQRWTDMSRFNNLSVIAGTYNGFKYHSYMICVNDPKITTLTTNSYFFVPNLGLVRYEQYSINDNVNPEKVYELISSTLLLEDSLNQGKYEYDFGNIKLGNFETVLLENLLINNTGKDVTVNSIEFIGDAKAFTLESALPLVITNGGSFNLKISASPLAAGKVEILVLINTSAGKYYLKITATGV